MKPDKLSMSMLFDCYGPLLTEKQRDCLDLYCNQDLTLAEIAENLGVSRQSVYDAVSRAESQMRRMERVTHCLSQRNQNGTLAAMLEQLAQTLTRQTPEQLASSAAALSAAAQALRPAED